MNCQIYFKKILNLEYETLMIYQNPQGYALNNDCLITLKKIYNQMIIRNIQIYRFSIPMQPFVIATGTMDYAQNLLLKVYTDNGIVGIGESSAFPMIVGETQDTMMVMAQEFAKNWKGKDPLDIEERIADLHAVSAFNPTCKSAFDMALYDIAAKNANQPLYKFLGGEKRTVMSDITVGIGNPDVMASKAKAFVENGATIVKIKLGKDVRTDTDRVRKIREAVGKSTKLRLDANQGWSFEDAVLALSEMNQYDIEFCEQPMRTWYDDSLPELVERSPIKVMADESCYHHHDARVLIKNKACDAINIKLAKSGGINEALKIYDVATMNNIPCMIGGMLESRIAATACLHFGLACKRINYFDLDTSLIGHIVDPVIGGMQFNKYEISLSDEIGIGADVDPQYLKGCEMIKV